MTGKRNKEFNTAVLQERFAKRAAHKRRLTEQGHSIATIESCKLAILLWVYTLGEYPPHVPERYILSGESAGVLKVAEPTLTERGEKLVQVFINTELVTANGRMKAQRMLETIIGKSRATVLIFETLRKEVI